MTASIVQHANMMECEISHLAALLGAAADLALELPPSKDDAVTLKTERLSSLLIVASERAAAVNAHCRSRDGSGLKGEVAE